MDPSVGIYAHECVIDDGNKSITVPRNDAIKMAKEIIEEYSGDNVHLLTTNELKNFVRKVADTVVDSIEFESHVDPAGCIESFL